MEESNMENSNNISTPPPLPPNYPSTGKVNISTEKLFGGFGLIFILLSVIPFIGLVFWLIGFILLTMSMYQLSKRFNAPPLFNNFLIAVALSFLSWIIALVLGVIGSLSAASLSRVSSGADFGLMIAFLTLYFIALVVAYFYNKSFTLLASITKHNLFKIASITTFIGVATTMILLGIVIVPVGLILLAIAFFTAPDEVEVRS